MPALSEELRTVRLWRARKRQDRRTRAEDRAEAEALGVAHTLEKVRPAEIARTTTEGHEPDPMFICSCGKASEPTYREHLIRILDKSRLLRVPGHVVAQITGEGW